MFNLPFFVINQLFKLKLFLPPTLSDYMDIYMDLAVFQGDGKMSIHIQNVLLLLQVDIATLDDLCLSPPVPQ